MTDAFPLLGEPLALDLVNTRTAEGDLLDGPSALAAWLEQQSARLTPPAEVGEAELAAVRAVREATRAALDAVRAGGRPELHALNAALAAAPAYRELSWDASGPSVTVHRAATPDRALAAELAEAAVDLLTDPKASRIRACEAADCVLIFLPAHPRRRWCVATTCGNRTRVARYYARHKGEPQS
ncbi:ABATE domain-containing protein [Streptomyces sp. WAC06614]|uniref:CGNR zinc finger domain-containing protein n=1 Tax=Streptomyces sp. WAC06614 TaxID=2487416 RepID=UPI000F771F7A|nr:ABATE domain-containing protein [Streptomyces sp. WAC06614]RSS68665.1 hypothetical protein EF918_28125 [Streptomyces sp. WAC06614]